MDGEDLPKLPMSMRKANPRSAAVRLTHCHLYRPAWDRRNRARSVPRRVWDELESLVSKRSDRPYRGRRL